jgi:hypothetical protein
VKSLPRKASKLQLVQNRTANRHRWERREDEGERVRGPQGTRQISDRNFGIRSASLLWGGRSERFPANCLSKTQLPAKSQDEV